MRKKLLVHICCSIDSLFFLYFLKKTYAQYDISGFFYNPNIHPKAEYKLRLADVKKTCKYLDIPLFEGVYDYDGWYDFTKDLALEPEKGKRCLKCFDFRIKASFDFAKKYGFDLISSTLLASPKKDKTSLFNSFDKISKELKLEFLIPDFGKNASLQIQQSMAKEAKLYHQNYCGCLYALRDQKEGFELISDIWGRILPNSIEEKMQIFKKVYELSKNKQDFSLIKQKFLNYRCFFMRLSLDKKLTASYLLFYSHFKNKELSFNIKMQNPWVFFHRDEILLLEFDYFNKYLINPRKNLKALLKNPLDIKEEMRIRKLFFNEFNLNPIIIVENIYKAKLEISANTKIFQDSCEKIWQT